MLLDDSGLIKSWLPADTALDQLLHDAYGWLVNTCPIQPNGLPTYMSFSKFPPAPNPYNPASLFAVLAEFASVYFPYTGDRRIIDHSEVSI